jgi:hypothetical protein
MSVSGVETRFNLTGRHDGKQWRGDKILSYGKVSRRSVAWRQGLTLREDIMAISGVVTGYELTQEGLMVISGVGE